MASRLHDHDSSDYGPDFTTEEEIILNKLLTEVDQTEDHDSSSSPRPRTSPHENSTTPYCSNYQTVQQRSPAEIPRIHVEVSAQSGGRPLLGEQSPLHVFRKKTLSVTDLVSPSWCELQYYYSLKTHGKIRRTPAMKQGSAVHKKLEDEVHKTVEVAIESKEDAWGIRLWNVITGLKTLRDTGMTRELELWGVIDGEVVNGVVDQLCFVCPDITLEDYQSVGPGREDESPAGDLKVQHKPADPLGGELRSLRSISKRTSSIYLTDVKTRTSKSIPRGAGFRLTLYQLMLYRLLLSNLATDKVDANIIFERYKLRGGSKFSDSFLMQVVGLGGTFHEAQESSSRLDLRRTDQDPLDLLIKHNSLYLLWRLMIQEFQLTFPRGSESIGNVLGVEYREFDGSILGMKTFLYDSKVVKEYVEDEMKWWKGEREARGVCIEEAFKCKMCEFGDTCDWRIRKFEDFKESRIRSIV